jgi:GxxExxY protein
MKEIVYPEESYQIMGACFEVYRVLGAGFVEAVYQESLELELSMRGVPFRPQPPLALYYKDHKLTKTCEPDFICYDKIIVELKAADNLDDAHRAQVHNYLRATRFRLGLINFGHSPKLEYERIVY